MRQAGRSLPEYRALRADTGMLAACLTPELACEITLQPVRRHGVDAAILFSDIVVPLHAAGIGVDIVGHRAGRGRTGAHRGGRRAAAGLDAEQVAPVADAVGLLVRELGSTPLIGFAGAPFTLASYLVEGGPSRNHERTKALMHAAPDVWHALMARLADITATFLRAQVDAGVDAVQLFDSWAARSRCATTGSTSCRTRRACSPGWPAPACRGSTSVSARVSCSVRWVRPVRTSSASTGGFPWTRRSGAPAARALQGNLDPAVLFADTATVEAEARRIVAEGRAAPGHVFNLGHGVLPGTDPDVLTRLVELVHGLEP